uniref:Uncharacterized protein n=1 Tax=Anguilla anguilla TaxID=7936 RepID=A0A0E9VL31_ANGAN
MSTTALLVPARTKKTS